MPGPKEVLYFKDAKLLATYPISTMTAGGGVNITMVTYNNIAQIGLVCCNRKIDSLEPLAQYIQEAFDMLEACVDNPSLSVEDIGEIVSKTDKAVVMDDLHELNIARSA
jgi:diacylglycerol O-acyltransferase